MDLEEPGIGYRARSDQMFVYLGFTENLSLR
jgi:hypothetical protein